MTVLKLRDEQFGAAFPVYEPGLLPKAEGGARHSAFLLHADLDQAEELLDTDSSETEKAKLQEKIQLAKDFQVKKGYPGGAIHRILQWIGPQIVGLIRCETDRIEGDLAKGILPHRNHRLCYCPLIQVPFFSESYRFALSRPKDPELRKRARALRENIFETGIKPAVKLASDIGAEFIGAGKLNSAISDNAELIDGLYGCKATSGSSYTAWCLYQQIVKNLRRLMKTKALFRTGHLLFCGASGAVGSATLELLAFWFRSWFGGHVSLGCQDDPVSIRRANSVKRKLINELGFHESRVSVEIDIPAAARTADVIVTVTSAGAAEMKIQVNDLKGGALWEDPSRPSNHPIEAESADHFLLTDGPFVRMPGVFLDRSNFPLGLYLPDLVFPCLGETVGAGLAGLTHSQSIGDDRSAQLALKVFKQQKKLGFELAESRLAGKVIPEDRYEEVRTKGSEEYWRQKGLPIPVRSRLVCNNVGGRILAMFNKKAQIAGAP